MTYFIKWCRQFTAWTLRQEVPRRICDPINSKLKEALENSKTIKKKSFAYSQAVTYPCTNKNSKLLDKSICFQHGMTVEDVKNRAFDKCISTILPSALSSMDPLNAGSFGKLLNSSHSEACSVGWFEGGTHTKYKICRCGISKYSGRLASSLF